MKIKKAKLTPKEKEKILCESFRKGQDLRQEVLFVLNQIINSKINDFDKIEIVKFVINSGSLL